MVSVKKKYSGIKKKGRGNIPWKLPKEEEKRRCSWVQCALTIDQCAVLQGKMSVTSNITHV